MMKSGQSSIWMENPLGIFESVRTYRVGTLDDHYVLSSWQVYDVNIIYIFIWNIIFVRILFYGLPIKKYIIFQTQYPIPQNSINIWFWGCAV